MRYLPPGILVMTMGSGNDNTYDTIGALAARKRRQAPEVARLLESDFGLDADHAEKLAESYFSDGFLPHYYFFSNDSEEIAGHAFIIMQLLSANTDYIKLESGDGMALTYFVNVGRDFPGTLARILEENLLMDIAAFDSVKAASGIRIVTLEKYGRCKPDLCHDDGGAAEALKGLLPAGSFTAEFIRSLPPGYLNEEMNIIREKMRIRRHLDLFSRARSGTGIIAGVEEVDPNPENHHDGPELRVSIAMHNPDSRFVIHALKVFETHGLNIRRSYLDTFRPPQSGNRVVILSVYLPGDGDLGNLVPEIRSIVMERPGGVERARDILGEELEDLVRNVCGPRAGEPGSGAGLARLRELARANGDISVPGDFGNFLLNAVTDFFSAADFLGILDNDDILLRLLRFESIGEFYISSGKGDAAANLPGYRFIHSTIRGPGKGGLRLDPIVRFDEVCALAFMMTWKTARSRILFGGAKGGLLVSPRSFTERRHDFIETIENFGRSLFLITGPLRDVPAGDVGCGGDEIGILFEGFKSVLRDLALVASGIRRGVTLVGNRAVSVSSAGKLLDGSFGISRDDGLRIMKLVTSERYLELAAAPQITGKPRMGIAAREGAAGRGLLYGILAIIGRLHLDGRWEDDGSLTAGDRVLLGKAAGYTEEEILKGRGALVDGEEWKRLVEAVYPALLRGKRVILQGTGKVGGALLKEIAPFGINLVGVADAGGAIIGENLDPGEILRAVASSPEKSCVGVRGNVAKVLKGAVAGAAVLELACDLLLPCALENVITADVAQRLGARLVASGGNGTVTSKGYAVLHTRGVPVLCDFIANSGGVIASYFEWLENLHECARYEAETIHGRSFDAKTMDRYLMPEFRDRIRAILEEGESPGATARWNMVMRDIIFSSVNGDYDAAKNLGIPMVTAGLAGAVLRVLAAAMARMPEREFRGAWKSLPGAVKSRLMPYFHHPEIRMFNPDFDARLLIDENT